VKNPNAIILEAIYDEENFDSFDQEAKIIQVESLESVYTDEDESSMYVFDEHVESNISQVNVVQIKARFNKFKAKENVEK
jgi:hypothetical protein